MIHKLSLIDPSAKIDDGASLKFTTRDAIEPRNVKVFRSSTQTMSNGR